MQQTDIFLQDAQSSKYAELCAVLYERELKRLSYSDFDANTLKRQIRSLPFYIKKVSRWLLAQTSPLDFDIQNASWFAAQTLKAPRHKENERHASWFKNHVSLGLVLPVLVQTELETRVRLDTVDKVDLKTNSCRLNHRGWFSFTGLSLESEHLYLLKPTPRIMGSACAGHRWGVMGRMAPQPLNLRELLLTSLLHWPAFHKVSQPKPSH